MVLEEKVERKKTQENAEPEENAITLNTGEKKRNSKNGHFFKGKFSKCGKYDHRASDCWGNRKKMTTETTIILQGSPASTVNTITVEK